MTNEELVLDYQRSGNVDALATLYGQNIGMIHKISSAYIWAADPDDLEQEAFFGVYKAANNYDVSRGVKFSTYLHSCIKSALYRYVCKECAIPAALEAITQQYQSFIASYEAENGCSPADDDIAKQLGLTPGQIGVLKGIVNARCTVSLSEPIGEGLTFEDTLSDERDPYKQSEDRAAFANVWRAVRLSLNDKEVALLIALYGDEALITDAARRVGVSVKQAKESITRALEKLRQSKELIELAESIGFSCSGLSYFHNYGMSSVEAAVILHERNQKRSKLPKSDPNCRKCRKGLTAG